MNDLANAPSVSDIEHATDMLDHNFDLLAGVTLRVSVEVGSASLKLSDLLNMSKGSVIELDRDANALLDILANGTLIARGEVVTVDGRYGIRVAEIVERRTGADRRLQDRGTLDRRAS